MSFSTSEQVVDDAHKELLTTLRELQKSERVCSRLMLQLEGRNDPGQLFAEEVDSNIALVLSGKNQKEPVTLEGSSGRFILNFNLRRCFIRLLFVF